MQNAIRLLDHISGTQTFLNLKTRFSRLSRNHEWRNIGICHPTWLQECAGGIHILLWTMFSFFQTRWSTQPGSSSRRACSCWWRVSPPVWATALRSGRSPHSWQGSSTSRQVRTNSTGIIKLPFLGWNTQSNNGVLLGHLLSNLPFTRLDWAGEASWENLVGMLEYD